MRYSDSLSGWITPETEEMAKAVDGLEPEVDHVPLPERLRGVLAWQDLLRSTGPEDAYHMEVCDLIARLVEKLVNAELTASGLLLCEEPGLTADEIMEKYAHLMPPEPD